MDSMKNSKRDKIGKLSRVVNPFPPYFAPRDLGLLRLHTKESNAPLNSSPTFQHFPPFPRSDLYLFHPRGNSIFQISSSWLPHRIVNVSRGRKEVRLKMRLKRFLKRNVTEFYLLFNAIASQFSQIQIDRLSRKRIRVTKIYSKTRTFISIVFNKKLIQEQPPRGSSFAPSTEPADE